MAPIPEATILAIRLYRLQTGIEALERAYVEARRATEVNRRSLEDRWSRFMEEVDTGNAALQEEGPDGSILDHGDDMAEAWDETDGTLKLIREAFTISLHHLWERELRRLTGRREYKQEQAIAFLKEKSKSPDETALDTLRLVANVAKHSAGGSADDLFGKRPDLFDTSRSPSGTYKPTYDDLRVSDAEVAGFFEAARDAIR